MNGDVRYWHRADIRVTLIDVRFWGKSGQRHQQIDHLRVQRRRYSAAIVGSSRGSNGSPGSLAFDAFSRCRSTIKSWKHSIGTEYLCSALENFVRNEITTLLPSVE
jgi:hypothetical protein